MRIAAALLLGVVSAGLSPALFAANAAPVAAPAAAAKSPPATAAPAGQAIRVLIAASREARLSSTMEGRLLALPKVAGSTFKKGDLLAEFDCAAQKAEQAMAAARLDKAQRTLDSQLSLNKLNAVSDFEVSLAKADVAEAKARAQQVEVSVTKCTISAPYNGRVVRRIANQFETLAAGQPILEIVESGVLRLEMLVPSRWLAFLKVGQPFTVRVDELNRDVTARITVLGAKVDAVSQTVSVQAEITQQVPGILPGMSGSAMLAGSPR